MKIFFLLLFNAVAVATTVVDVFYAFIRMCYICQHTSAFFKGSAIRRDLKECNLYAANFHNLETLQWPSTIRKGLLHVFEEKCVGL